MLLQRLREEGEIMPEKTQKTSPERQQFAPKSYYPSGFRGPRGF
jgi:hypothetical protein